MSRCMFCDQHQVDGIINHEVGCRLFKMTTHKEVKAVKVSSAYYFGYLLAAVFVLWLMVIVFLMMYAFTKILVKFVLLT